MSIGAWNWISVVIAGLLVIGYELHSYWRGQRDPVHQARFVNERVRLLWVQGVAERPGFEIVAVQALRNSLMAATITATTSALALMGIITVGGASLAAGLAHFERAENLLHLAHASVAVVLLFGSHVCAVMCMRFFNHASFIVSLPADSPQRKALNAAASDYVRLGGRLYGWALRLFLMVVPPVCGFVVPLSVMPATLVLLVALWFFDRPVHIELERIVPPHG